VAFWDARMIGVSSNNLIGITGHRYGLDEMLAAAREAESLGFDGIWVHDAPLGAPDDGFVRQSVHFRGHCRPGPHTQALHRNPAQPGGVGSYVGESARTFRRVRGDGCRYRRGQRDGGEA
jgi:hypothetical protein